MVIGRNCINGSHVTLSCHNTQHMSIYQFWSDTIAQHHSVCSCLGSFCLQTNASSLAHTYQKNSLDLCSVVSVTLFFSSKSAISFVITTLLLVMTVQDKNFMWLEILSVQSHSHWGHARFLVSQKTIQAWIVRSYHFKHFLFRIHMYAQYLLMLLFNFLHLCFAISF